MPQMLFCDNGSEFTSQVLDLWAYHNQVKIDFSRPGKPTDNACRPHRALGERTPNEFARQIAASRDLSCLANAEN